MRDPRVEYGNSVCELIDELALLTKVLEESFRLAQVSGVEAFAEPAIDLGQQLPSLLALALLLQEPTHAQRSAQFQGLSLLVASNVESLPKTASRPSLIACREAEEQLSLQAIRFRLVGTFPGFLRYR